MANFLTVNGLAVPVALNSFEEGEPEVIGASERAANGGLVESLVATKRAAAFKTTPQLASVAEAWNQLLRGEGERWSFDSNLYGSKGTPPSSATGLTISSGGIGPKHGAGYLAISSTYSFAVAAAYSTSYSAVLWRNESSAWVHYVVIFDGTTQTRWRNGLSHGSSITAWFNASGGTITLGPGSADFDDVCLFPFALPSNSTFVNQLLTWHNANAWPNLPALKVQGDAIPDAAGYRLCKGVVKGANLMRGALGGTKYSNLTQLSVGLLEV